ncbi:hypothetical protein PMAYCL1PPCAC_29210, partial [Pristionchus mayeri]
FEEIPLFSINAMPPLTPIETTDHHHPSVLSPPYTPSSSYSSQSSPHLILSPKDFAPFRAFRRRENVNYSEVKRRTKKSDDVIKPVVLPSHKRKSHKVKVREGEWEVKGAAVRKRVYTNNATSGQFRPCFEETKRIIDSLVLREGDDVTAVTEDEEGERIVGVARVTRIYVVQKSRELFAAILWYYLPSQVEDPSMRADPHEIFPSRHLDSLPLRSIENKVEVMTTSQYIQYRSALARSKTFPYCQTEKVDEKEEFSFFFARHPYDCVRKRILWRDKK